MRLALLGLVASLSSLPLLAQDDLRVAQSPVAIIATFSRTGVTKDPVKRSDGDVNVSTPLDTVSYGNKVLLRTLLAAQDPAITSVTGWSLVAVWGNWPAGGNSYKFFAYNSKSKQAIHVPDSLLKLEFTDPAVGEKVNRKNGKIVSGSGKHKSLAQLTIGALGVSDDTKRDTFSGLANGLVFGTNSYGRSKGADTAIYRPVMEIFTGYGIADNPGAEQDDMLSVRIRIGASSSVPASRFAVPGGPAIPTTPAEGPGVAIP